MARTFIVFLVVSVCLVFYSRLRDEASLSRDEGQGIGNAARLASDSSADRIAPADIPFDTRPVDRSNRLRLASYSDVLSEVTPAVVSVYPSRVVRIEQQRPGNRIEDLLRRYYGLGPGPSDGEPREEKLQVGLGSGVLVTADGLILTNNHVVTDERGNDADEILVRLHDDTEVLAELVGRDPKSDIALLKVEGTDFHHLRMADSDNLLVGDVVFAVGNPLGVGTTVTMGIVSATGRSNLNIISSVGQAYENFIQTDASINPGNSGGALVDTEGRLVGINTAILSGTGGNIGIGFAIPSRMARFILTSLLRSGSVPRGYLGVAIADLTPDLAEAFQLETTRGVLIQQVIEDLPADRAGLRAGDVIVALEEVSVNSVAELRLLIAETPPGTSVAVKALRKGLQKSFVVVLTDQDNPHAHPRQEDREMLQGVSLEVVTDKLRQDYDIDEAVNGLLVVQVDGNSPYRNSVRKGMVLIEVNDQPVESVADAGMRLREGINKLWIYEAGSYRYLAIRLRPSR